MNFPDSTNLFDVIFTSEDVFLRVFAHLQYVYRMFPVRCQIDV